MKAIGFRIDKDTIYWAAVSGTTECPVLEASDKHRAPATFSQPDLLKWARNQVINIIQEHCPTAVTVRFQETFLPHKPSPSTLESMLTRARIEGVVIETASSLGIPVSSGSWQMISSRMGSRSAKSYLDSEDVRGMNLSDIRNKNQKEAILAGVAALSAASKDADQG